MTDKARAELAPTGILRAGINLSNFLLVTGRSEKSEPVGVAPDMAKELAASLGVPVTYVTFKSPGELADQAGKNAWDVGLIGAEPQRAAVMNFSAAYVEIEATYMVPPGSPLKSIAAEFEAEPRKAWPSTPSSVAMRRRPSALDPANRLCWPYCVGGMSSQANRVRLTSVIFMVPSSSGERKDGSPCAFRSRKPSV